MDTWWVPQHQSDLKRSKTRLFGYDQTGKIDYQFNANGFRGQDFVDQDSVFAIGNSVSFGIGLPNEQTYLDRLAQRINRAAGNLSFGCYAHENHDHLPNLANLARRNRDDIILIQINNLDRRRQGDQILRNNHSAWCVARLRDYMETVDELLKHKTILWIYWDDKNHDLPRSLAKKITLSNKGHVDHSLPGMVWTFGVHSHNFIFRALYRTIQTVDQKIIHIL